MTTDALTFSPIDNEAPLRLQRKIGLVPKHGLGVGRRAAFLAAVSWLPVAIWAVATHRFSGGPAGESLLQHFGVHVRSLVAIPLMILAEAAVHKVMSRLIPQFLSSGIVGPSSREAFDRVFLQTRRLRDTTLPWILLLGVVLAWTLGHAPDPRTEDLSWALESDGTLGFGGFWLAYVTAPIFVALLLAWIWRLFLVTLLFARIGRLDLSLVPAHPDRAGGLGFLHFLPGAFSLVTFSLTSVLASRWAHDILYHGQSVLSLKVPATVFAAICVVALLLPTLMFTPALFAARRKALLDYASLVATHGNLVHRRWILRKPVADEPILDAPELGPSVDIASIYSAVAAMRPFPFGVNTLVVVLLPIAIPLLVVIGIQVPLKDVLLKLVKTLL
jgi:hypothetical protein